MTVFERIESAACGCDGGHAAKALMSVGDAVAVAISQVARIADTEEVPLDAASGRVLAAPVLAGADMPRFDNAAMDGYALRLADLPASGTLPVRGTAAAGDAPAALPPGVMMRIYTGAPIPEGADTVVMQEIVKRQGGRATVTGAVHAGDNIRTAGADQRRRDAVLAAGTRLEAKHIAICAGAGAGRVTVRRRVRAALLMTGDEIAPAGQPLTGGAIWDTNTPMLTALCQEAGVEIIAVRQAPDRRAELAAALAELAGEVDLIVTSGGISVGDRDQMKPALGDLGARIVVSGVAIKPGKPVTVSRLGKTMILSLPGNPVSAYVTWHVLGRVLVDRLTGAQAHPLRRHVRAAAALKHKPGRCEYRPATITGYDGQGIETVACAPHVNSANLGPLSAADGLILIPADTEAVAAGDMLEFLPL